MVIVTTDSKGRTCAYARAGRDQDEAFRMIEREYADTGGRWMVHWEKGFQSKDDAEERARNIERQLDSGTSEAVSRIN